MFLRILSFFLSILMAIFSFFAGLFNPPGDGGGVTIPESTVTEAEAAEALELYRALALKNTDTEFAALPKIIAVSTSMPALDPIINAVVQDLMPGDETYPLTGMPGEPAKITAADLSAVSVERHNNGSVTVAFTPLEQTMKLGDKSYDGSVMRCIGGDSPESVIESILADGGFTHTGTVTLLYRQPRVEVTFVPETGEILEAEYFYTITADVTGMNISILTLAVSATQSYTITLA